VAAGDGEIMVDAHTVDVEGAEEARSRIVRQFVKLDAALRGANLDPEIVGRAPRSDPVRMGREGGVDHAEISFLASREIVRGQNVGLAAFAHREQIALVEHHTRIHRVLGIAEEHFANRARERRSPTPEETLLQAPLAEETLGEHHSRSTEGTAALETDGADCAITVEPMGVGLTSRHEPPRAIAIERALEVWRERSVYGERFEAMLARQIDEPISPRSVH
jgi:hypothetical protein